MTDLRERAPAQALMAKFVSLRGTPDVVELPLGIVHLSKDGLNWLRGIRGELHMATRLRALGSDWTVLHSVPVGTRGSDIDHIVIGPAGVFPINTKRPLERRVWVAGSRFLVDGRQRDYLRNSDFEASRVEGVLRRAGIQLSVMPVIAVSGAKRLTVRGNPTWNGRNIGVARAEDVVRRIRRRRSTLSSRQVASIVALLSDSSTWSAIRLSADDPTIRAAYERIDRGVTRWNLLIALIGCAIIAGVLVLAGAIDSWL